MRIKRITESEENTITKKYTYNLSDLLNLDLISQIIKKKIIPSEIKCDAN